MELSKTNKVAQAATRVVGASAGGLLATIAGPELGVATAAALTEVGLAGLEHWGGRVQRHVGETLALAADQTRTRMGDGDEVRDDLSDEEIAALKQAVVEAAAQSNEDRKCDVIANLYVAAAFDQTITIDDALLYIGRIRRTSWRQLVFLQYLLSEDRAAERAEVARSDEARNVTGNERIFPALSAELSELGGTLELIGTGMPGGRVDNPQNVFGGAQMTSRSVLEMTGTGLGRRLADLGDLRSVVGKTEPDRLAQELEGLPSAATAERRATQAR